MAETTAKTLLTGGTLLIHDDNDHVVPRVADLLIEGSQITKISPDIKLSDDDSKQVNVIDCKGKIISPGFISTHHHMYQSALKGRHADHTLARYMPGGNMVGSLFTLEDAFWGQLAGAMEAVDAGTTTVVEHPAINISPEYPPTAVQAFATSGLRTIYCYCVPHTVHSWDPFSFADDFASPWAMDTFKSLAASAPFANGRVRLGFAVDNLYQGEEAMKSLYSTIREAKAALITTHGAGGPMFGGAPTALQMLGQQGLLGRDILVSHANYPAEGDAELLQKSGASISCTPNTELQMAMPPLGLRKEFYANASLGVDCHSWGTGYMPGQMRLALQYARCEKGEKLAAQGKWSLDTGFSVESVFNLGTIAGAKAVGLADQVGRIKEGMKADLVVFDTSSPSMIAAAEENPVAAVVLHSSERDVDAVIVDGILRKQGAKLLDVTVAEAPGNLKPVAAAGKSLSWKDVSRGLLESRDRLNDKTKGIDMTRAMEGVLDAFHVNRENIVD